MFLMTPSSFYAAQSPVTPGSLEFFKIRYTSLQVTYGGRTPFFPVAGQYFNFTSAGTPIKANGKEVDWGNGRYMQFALEADTSSNPEALIDDISKSGKKYNIILVLYENNGKVVEIISRYGNILGMGYNGFVYDVEGLYGACFYAEPRENNEYIDYPFVVKATKLSDLVKYTTELASCRPDLDFLKLEFIPTQIWVASAMDSVKNTGKEMSIKHITRQEDPADNSKLYLLPALEVDRSNNPSALIDDINNSGKKFLITMKFYNSEGSYIFNLNDKGNILGVGDKGFLTVSDPGGSYFFLSFTPMPKYPTFWKQKPSDEIKYKIKLAQVKKLSELKIVSNLAKGKSPLPVLQKIRSNMAAKSAKTISEDFSKAPYSPISPIVFNPGVKYGTMTDQDGITYKTVTIGTKTWMAENLRTTRYRNGDPITHQSYLTDWESKTSGIYCYVSNVTNRERIAVYGALYNWFAVNDPRNIAPAGWHVPTNEEWVELLEATMGQKGKNERFWLSGYQLMEKGTIHWTSQQKGVTNDSGFTAFPVGTRTSADYWTSTGINATHAWRAVISSMSTLGDTNKTWGNSVRLVKD